MSLSQDLVEKVAETIYRYRACHPEEYEQVMGQPMKLWKTDAPWDTNPNELAEHERDDYRRQARAVLNLLQFS
jgi:hypothetical protein